MPCPIQLLISVVRRGRGDKVVRLAKAAGARGSTVLYGRGTAPGKWLRMLGLADTKKEVVFTIADQSELPPIITALRSAPDLCKKVSGIGFTLNVGEMLHSGQAMTSGVAPSQDCSASGDRSMPQTSHELLCVIVNTGFADDVMNSARAAGASGGTIVRARGTGKEEDSSFFGIIIVPEKEFLLVLVERSRADQIWEAIRKTPCLDEPGVGIMFRMPVTSFFPLGLANQ